MSKKAVVAGHICVDITPVFPDQGERKIADILVPGKLVHMNQAEVSTGGSVANTGLAMKMLGTDVKLMGKIGNDELGKMLLSVLGRIDPEGSRDMIISDTDGTSYSVVIAVPGVDRIFLHSPGANDTFCYDDLDFDVIRDAALFHFGYPPIMKLMYQDTGDTLRKIFQRVKSMGVATSMDMSVIDPSSEAGHADWRTILQKVLPYVDFFVPSAEELCFMLDRDRYDEWITRAAGKDVTEVLDIERDVEPLAEEVLAMGARMVVIKCGVPGMYYQTSGKQYMEQIGAGIGLNAQEWADCKGFEHSYIPDAVLSGTGAGDTSIAAFLTAMLRGCSLEMCMHMAAAAGASCVASYSALGGLKSFEELEARVRAGWKKRK